MDWSDMFFAGWAPLGRILAVGVLAYVCLVALLRVSGKRTLAKMNAFDLVVTVALGSTLATILLSKETSLSEGVVALGLLIGCQYVVAWTATRSRFAARIVKSDPTLLFYRGQFLEQTLLAERVTREEVLSAIRAQGQADLRDVEAVVLETDGTFSVASGRGAGPETSSLEGVRGRPGLNARREYARC